MTNRLTRSPMRRTDGFAYNLFRDPQRPAIYCAVPEHYPVPRFLDGWLFVGSLRSPANVPSGFNERAAAVGVRCNGFYLFQVTAEPERRTAMGMPRPSEQPSPPRPIQTPCIRLNDNRIRLAEVG
jgi:hypothetical protein